MQGVVSVRGARQHNLRGVDVDIPRGSLTVFTGVSGSGKSSLAFDTICAEGRRRYMESLSLPARQLLGRMEQPDVDAIEGLPPAVAIAPWGRGAEQPGATVATVTGLHDHLRLLFTHLGVPHCLRCGEAVEPTSVAAMVAAVLSLPSGTGLMVLAPLAAEGKDWAALGADLRRQGFVRVRVDGALHELSDPGLWSGPVVPGIPPGRLELVVDRLRARPDAAQRLAESLETACRMAGGVAWIAVQQSDGGERTLRFTLGRACPACGAAVERPRLQLFSFHSAHGACPACAGLGSVREVDAARVLPDPGRSLAEGAIGPWPWSRHRFARELAALATRHGLTPATPLRAAPTFVQEALYGTREPLVLPPQRQGGVPGRIVWEGVLPLLQRLYAAAGGEGRLRAEIEAVMTVRTCPLCDGRRLRPEALAVRLEGQRLVDVEAWTVGVALAWVQGLVAAGSRRRAAAAPILQGLAARLERLERLGLGYLTLDRSAATLSSGEGQRLHLASQLGGGLSGVLYVLDEPSLGLHPRDAERLIATLRALQAVGNTVLVVEHDEAVIRAADWVVDLGPGPGPQGGAIVVAGTPDEVAACPESVTGAFLSGRRSVPVPARRRPSAGVLALRGVSCRNLRDLDVEIPLGCFVAVTGVSGAGKTTLLRDVLLAHLERRGETGGEPAPPGRLEGGAAVGRVLRVDGSPIGRTPHANPATYVGLMDDLRRLYAETPEARARGYGPGRFSFNLPGGRCEACGGDGVVRLEMGFLPEVHVTCEACGGSRYNRETLEIRYRGLSVAEALGLNAVDALGVFGRLPSLRRKLQALVDVGLGYLALGQAATTLSGGEAQRLKLAAELARGGAAPTLYALDEPTTGLHPADVQQLVRVLHRLVDHGHTAVVVAHDMDVVKTADWVIDLGPDGGAAGGRLVVAGTPEDVARCPESRTAPYLAAALAKGRSS